MSFMGNRFDASVGLANSFIKNMYSDNYGIKQIGINPTRTIVLNDDMYSDISVKTYSYNIIEYYKYDTKKNDFTNIDNSDASSKIEDDSNYDEAVFIEMWSNIDINKYDLNKKSDLTKYFKNLIDELEE